MYLPSFELKVQKDLNLLNGVKLSSDTQINSAKMCVILELSRGLYQEEGLAFKRTGDNIHFIEESFVFVVTDADSDEMTENLPMIVARVEKDKFLPYK